MLPKDLMDVRKFGGSLMPRFAGAGDVGLAGKVIKIYRICEGKRLRLAREAVKRLEDGSNYKKVRGFAKIVERMCEIESRCKVDPKELRRFLFERGYVTRVEERERVIREAAEFFGIEPEEVEEFMFSDLEEERVIVRCPELRPEDLVKLYNLSLLQTVLFNSLRFSFWISSNHKAVLRAVKRLGLMYELSDDGVVTLTGAASVIKMTRRYGTAMAKVVPEIIRAERWWMRAEVVDEYEKRVYLFELSDRYRGLFPELKEKVEYDSSLEEEFERRIKFLLNCEVIREPGIVRAGRYAYIPDFLIRKDGKEVYVEIAGFWTEEYIRRKLEKIRKADIPLLLIVREELALGRPKGVLDVVTMKGNRIPYRDVVKKIKEILYR